MHHVTSQKAGLFAALLLTLPAVAMGGEHEDSEDHIETEEIVVTTTGRALGPRHVYQPTTSMDGDELQRNLSSSVPATLESVPGFHVQYNGPGATNPTIRGMPGDRVLMLEDGHRTGDIYWTASDHGVMVEPISAARMEVIRGPASLLYGSNALGGVVNVIREDVPTFRPDVVEGTVTTQLESVNNGLGGGAVLRGPLGPLAFYAEATGRRAGDTKTPAGPLEQTQMAGFNLASGLSWVPEWGVVGAAVRYFDTVYGVPGEFGGELIPGGHPGGVDIEASRLSSRFHADYEGPLGVFDGLELRTNVTRYLHDEIEGTLGDQDILGARFVQISTDSHLVAHHDAVGDPEDSVSIEGALGLSFQSRDLEASGLSPGTRSGTERSVGGFVYEQLHRQPFRLQAGIRGDYRWTSTDDLSPLRVRTTERRIVKVVTPRTFGSISGSLATLWDFAEDWTIGASFSRSFRNPTIEELYSDGPHLADFSFDIGTPDLASEVGLGADVFLRAELSKVSVEAATYANRVDNYIYYSPTGETVRVFREGVDPRVTPVFEARGDDALFLGAEGRVQWEFVDDLVFDLTASYTRATRRAENDPLPFIPPLSGKVELRYEGSPFFGSIGSALSAPQNRVPRPIQVGDTTELPEQPTDGYAFAHALLGWRHHTRLMDHTIMLQGRNVGNQLGRDHLSRIKEVAPQPGRNIQLTYQAIF